MDASLEEVETIAAERARRRAKLQARWDHVTGVWGDTHPSDEQLHDTCDMYRRADRAELNIRVKYRRLAFDETYREQWLQAYHRELLTLRSNETTEYHPARPRPDRTPGGAA